MICPVCRSTDFCQDDEMNVYFCSRCQTQSQELFAESFEIEDGIYKFVFILIVTLSIVFFSQMRYCLILHPEKTI